MPRPTIFDISGIDMERVIMDRTAIREAIVHRGPIEQLDAIVYMDAPAGRIIGYRDVRPDEWWAEGHIPGRPLLPGVLQLETAAQLASVYMVHCEGWTGFMGFGGLDEVRFRQQVVPGDRLIILMQRMSIRHGRFIGQAQGLVNGNVAFDAGIIGIRM